MLSDVTINAMLVALPATVVAMATLVQTVRGNKKTDKAIEQNDVLDKKADQIHQLTDGNLSRISAELKTSNDKIQNMEKLFAMLEQKWGRDILPPASEGMNAQQVDAALERFREPK